MTPKLLCMALLIASACGTSDRNIAPTAPATSRVTADVVVDPTVAPPAPTNVKIAIPKVTTANVDIVDASWTDNSGGTATTQLMVFTDYYNFIATGVYGSYDWYVVDNAAPGVSTITGYVQVTPTMTQLCFRLRALYPNPFLASEWVNVCVDPKRTHRR